jgi:hypothetical protein
MSLDDLNNLRIEIPGNCKGGGEADVQKTTLKRFEIK